jgi:NADH-quinone oxidoreductase subunit J
MNVTLAVFWLFAGAAIVSALLCVTRRSPVASALWLVVTMFSLAGIFVLLDAQFIAALQVMVYAGAIMVLFLFVIMLLNLGSDRRSDMMGWTGGLVMLAIGTLLAVELLVLRRALPAEELRLPTGAVAEAAQTEGVVQVISEPLFRTFLIPFEITSVLLLAAVVGAVVLAKRKI